VPLHPILSTALVDTGSRMDDVFFAEFKGTGNVELRLRRTWPTSGSPGHRHNPSGNRRDELLISPGERAAIDGLRRSLVGLDDQQVLELLLGKRAGRPGQPCTP
jgi:transcription termination factor Rho